MKRFQNRPTHAELKQWLRTHKISGGADTTALNAAVLALTDQVAATEGTEASASALISGFAAQVTKAVTDALTADNAADQTSIDAANSAIAAVTARFAASASGLGAAVAANAGA